MACSKIRNAIEAGILAIVHWGAGLSFLSRWVLTARIIILCLTALPAALVALIGISGECLSHFLLLFLKYLRNRRVVGDDSGQQDKQRKSFPKEGRHQRQRKPNEKQSKPAKRLRSGEEDFSS